MYGYKKDLIILAIFAFSACLVFGTTPDIFASASPNSLNGRILLQVQAKGEAWYVNPGDNKRYYLGKPNDAYGLMRKFSVGVTNDNLNKILVGDGNLANGVDADGDGLSDALEDSLGTDKNKADTDGDSYNDRIEVLTGYNPVGAGKLPLDNKFASTQKGKILLQVQKNGEAWYVNPNDNKRYFLGRPQDAFDLMRKFGLGITDSDLDKIPLSQATNLIPDFSEKASSSQPYSAQASSTQESSADLEKTRCSSLDCLIGAASSCKISEATYRLIIPFPLAIRETMETIVYSIVMGENPDGSCTLTQQTQGSVVSISNQDKVIMLNFGLTSDQIDAQIDLANESLNNDAVLKAVLTCTETGENIAAYLENSKEGFNSLNCLLQNGEKERQCVISPGLTCVTRMP